MLACSKMQNSYLSLGNNAVINIISDHMPLREAHQLGKIAGGFRHPQELPGCRGGKDSEGMQKQAAFRAQKRCSFT